MAEAPSPEPEGTGIILASRSSARAAMLKSAGVRFRVVPADIDEAAIRETLIDGDRAVGPGDVAEVLASTKAEAVSRRHPEAIVIGSDQVLALGAESLAKPATLEEARAHLLRLRARVHELHSAVAIAEGGQTRWTHVAVASMAMRRFSIPFLDRYLGEAGRRVLSSVGAYEIEALGVQLFEEIDGDYFTILGMPLLPLLEELRTREVLAT